MTNVVDEKITIKTNPAKPAAKPTSSAPKAASSVSASTPTVNIQEMMSDVDTLVKQLGVFLKDVRETSKMADAFVETCISDFKSCFETLKADAGITAHLASLFGSKSTKEKEAHLTKLTSYIVAKKKEAGKA